MSATTTQPLTGTYAADPIHSSFGFAVRYMGVSTFRGTLDDVAATLTAGPDGVDARRAPRRSSRSRSRRRSSSATTCSRPTSSTPPPTPRSRSARRSVDLSADGRASVDGELTIRGATQPVHAEGTLVARRPRRSAAAARTSSSRRRSTARRSASTGTPTCRAAARRSPTTSRSRSTSRCSPRRRSRSNAAMRVLGISGSLRRDSHNRALLRAAAAQLAAAGAQLDVWDRLAELPALRRGPRRRAAPPAVADLREAIAQRRRGPDRDAGVQRLDPGRAQERARLGLAAVRPTTRCAASRSRWSAPAAGCSAPSGRRPRCARCSTRSARTCSSGELPVGQAHEAFDADGSLRDPDLRDGARRARQRPPGASCASRSGAGMMGVCRIFRSPSSPPS